MKALIVLALTGFSQFASAGVSPLNDKVVVCKNEVGTIQISTLSSIKIDVAAIPPLQPTEIHTQYQAASDATYSTGGIECGFPGSGRAGHHVEPCQEHEYLVGSDHGNTISINLKRNIDPSGTPTSGYSVQVHQVTVPRGDLPPTISEGAFYNLTFQCSIN